MAYDYEITEKAYHDIDEAINYIAIDLHNKKAALELLNKIYSTIEKICDYPLLYPDCTYFFIMDTNYRHAVINNYTLVYKIMNGKIIIIRFKHSKQNRVLHSNLW